MLSRDLFCVLVVLVAVQRVAELRVSRRNEAQLRARGALEHAPRHFRAMQLVHGSWLVSMLLEVELLHAPFHVGLAAVSLLVFVAGQRLRLSAMRALAWRWSARIFTVPGMQPVTAGIYRHLRHPNYLGVVLEIASLPLVHSAWRTALVYSALNAVLLYVRISAEERALVRGGGYQDSFAELPRLLPRWSSRSSS